MVLGKLKSARKANGLTQQNLAVMVCMHTSTIQHLEAGNSTTESNAKRIAVMLNCKVEDLV